MLRLGTALSLAVFREFTNSFGSVTSRLIGAGAMVAQDIPPFCMAQGDRATVQGLNRIGLERNGCTKDEFAVLREVYRTVFTSSAAEVKGRVFKDRVAYAFGICGESPKALAIPGLLAEL